MSAPSLVVVKALGLVTIQASPIRGRMHEGLSPGGPLVPALLARANARIGNEPNAPGIEVCGQLVLRALCDVVISTDRATHALAAGDEIAIASGATRVTYIAFAGGVQQMGSDPFSAHEVQEWGRTPFSTGTHLVAGIGGLLRAGDRIASSLAIEVRDRDAVIERDALSPHDLGWRQASSHEDLSNERPIRIVSGPDAEPAIRIVLGPDRDAFAAAAFDVLLGTAWRISASSDRTGTRLDGARLERRPAYVEQTRPMVIGAIEVPGSGAPIVLGPEHPTTGGYPVIAVVATSDLDAFHSIPLGGSVRFRV